MMELERISFLSVDPSVNKEAQFQVCKTKLYLRKEEIVAISMHISNETVNDNWKDKRALEYLKKENIKLCTLLSKHNGGISNVIFDDILEKLIKEL